MISLRTDSAKLSSANGSPKSTAPGKSHALACTLDPDLNITSANDAMCNYIDRSREMLLGTSFLCLIPEGSRNEATEIFNSLSLEDPLAIHEHSIHSSKGTRFLQWMHMAQFDCQGNLMSVHLAGREITDQKAEERLCSEHKQLLEIIEFLPDPTFVIDQDKNVVAWNSAIEELTGISKPEVMGRGGHAYSLPLSGGSGPVLIDLLDEYNYKASSIYPGVDRKEDTLFAEASMIDRHRGGEICIWAKASPLRDSQGRKIGAIELIKDITELKNAKDALSDARVELETRVMKRTRELKNSNEALIEEIQERKHAESMLRSSLQEKEILLKEVYHRVKNNLQIISSLLSLQSEYIRDEKAIEAFRESRNRIRSMSLIHEKIYRSEDLTRIDFVDYARNLITALMAAYNIHKNAIEVRLNAEGVSLEIDKAIPCGLIINELVSNALKHAFNHTSRGVIRIELRPQGDNNLVLIISDNGCGFPEEIEIGKSKSFGLKLVSTLVEQLKGTIDLKREGGTQIRITFAI